MGQTTASLNPSTGPTSTTAEIDSVDASAAVATDIGSQIPTFSDLLPEQAQPYWLLLEQYPIIEAAVIFLVFWASASFIRRYALSLIERLASKTISQLDDEIIADLREPIFNTVLWFGLIIATKSTGYVDGMAAYISPLALSMIVLAWTRATLSVSGKLITAMSRDDSRFKKMDVRTEPLLIISSKIMLMIMCAYVVLMIWGINPVGLLASAGIVGIAVGFAAKDTLANLFSGVFILADRPYKLGDYVNLDSGERGKVTHIGIRSTRLITRDDIEVTIPNGVIGNAKIVNENGGSGHSMRIRLDLQCAYESDLQQVENVLMALIIANQDIKKFPSPRVRFRGFGDSGINLQLMGWIDEPQDRGRISHMLYKEIHAAFARHNIEIPYPKRELTIMNYSKQEQNDSAQSDAAKDQLD
ncbi:MAG: small-conductance mechanosensitive channel [Arenicella sp.]|jgi:small-conductance mechanosensitive channel